MQPGVGAAGRLLPYYYVIVDTACLWPPLPPPPPRTASSSSASSLTLLPSPQRCRLSPAASAATGTPPPFPLVVVVHLHLLVIIHLLLCPIVLHVGNVCLAHGRGGSGALCWRRQRRLGCRTTAANRFGSFKPFINGSMSLSSQKRSQHTANTYTLRIWTAAYGCSKSNEVDPTRP